MRARNYLVAGMLLLGGCQAVSDERIDYPDDHVSLHKLERWTEGRDRGSLVFSDPDSRATIAVRARKLLEHDPPDLTRLLGSTEKVLASLPSGRVTDAEPLDHDDMKGAVFEVSFVPPGRTERYARRHAVLLGERHFYHAILTAPEAELAAATEQFSETVSSLREE